MKFLRKKPWIFGQMITFIYSGVKSFITDVDTHVCEWTETPALCEWGERRAHYSSSNVFWCSCQEWFIDWEPPERPINQRLQFLNSREETRTWRRSPSDDTRNRFTRVRTVTHHTSTTSIKPHRLLQHHFTIQFRLNQELFKHETSRWWNNKTLDRSLMFNCRITTVTVNI